MTRVALVTGIAGQTGSYLAENLVAHGWKVHGLVRPGDESLRDLGLTLDADLHDQDLVDAAGVASLVERLEQAAAAGSMAQSGSLRSIER